MASLPLFTHPNQIMMMMQTKWKSLLDPVISSQLLQGNLIENQTLSLGSTSITHLLQRNQVGWLIVDQTAPGMVYRSAPFNATSLVLSLSTLGSSTATTVSVTVSVWCF